MTLAGDQLRLLDALTRHGVSFVVGAGSPRKLHGWSGTTADLDIAVDASQENADRINRALAEAGVMSSAIGGFGTSFETHHGRLEIVRRADGVGKYEDWMRHASELGLEHLTIVVAAPSDVVRSKEAAGREKDRAALPGMRRDLGLEDGTGDPDPGPPGT